MAEIKDYTQGENKNVFKRKDLSDERKKSIKQAMGDGFKNQQCTKCGREFLADVHFVRCDKYDCPMKSKSGKSLLDILWGVTKDEKQN